MQVRLAEEAGDRAETVPCSARAVVSGVGRQLLLALLTYGRTPLIFYVIHFWTFVLVRLVLDLFGQQGVPLPWVLPLWLLVLVLLKPVCARYHVFKTGEPAESWWRML